MRRVMPILLASLVLSSCAMFQKPKTLEQVKADLVCIEYADGMTWGEIHERLGNADVAPLPEPGTNLLTNTRVFKNKSVIFSVENREFSQDGKTRFREIANKIEVCREK
jgi:hypothetical protein